MEIEALGGKSRTIELEGQRVHLYAKQIGDDEVYACMLMIPIEKIQVDAYQRHLDERRAAKLARDWQDVDVGTICLSAREGGVYACIDGQHRVRAAAIRGMDMLMAEVLVGLTKEQEARTFRTRNKGRRSVHPLDLYKTGLYAKDPLLVKIDKIVKDSGFHVNYRSFKRDAKGIVSAKTLYTLYAWEVLEDVLFTIGRTWPEDPLATDRMVMLAVGSLHFCFPELSHDRFSRELNQEGLRTLMSESRSYGRESTFMLAKFMLNAYNRGLSTNRLNARALEMPPMNAVPKEMQEEAS